MLAAPLRLAGAGLLLLLSLHQPLAAGAAGPSDPTGLTDLLARDLDIADLTEALDMLAARSLDSAPATGTRVARLAPAPATNTRAARLASADMLAARSLNSAPAVGTAVPRPVPPPPRGAGPGAGSRPFMPTFKSDYPYEGTGRMSIMPVGRRQRRR